MAIFSPLSGKPVITQPFGVNYAYYKKYGHKGHNGLDLKCPVGTPVYAEHEGYIRYRDEGNVGYGKHAIVTSMEYKPGLRRETTYGHLSKIMSYPPGSFVSAGDLIGLSGNTGDSTGPHLHVTYKKLDRDGNVIDMNNGFNGAIDVSQFTQNWTKNDLLAPGT